MVQRTLQTRNGYNRLDPPYSLGSEMLMRFLPVNAAQLTPSQEPMRWRLLSARDVIAELTPLYFKPKAKH